MDKFDQILELLKHTGLELRGVFSLENMHVTTKFNVRSGVLIGNVGGAFWSRFRAWQNSQSDHGGSEPLDLYSMQILSEIADTVGGVAVFPSDRPYLPFQQWAKQAESLQASPLGVLMHPEAGPWNAYRGAILFAQDYDADHPAQFYFACEDCADQPCIKICPADAVSIEGFATDRCVAHLSQPKETKCEGFGCLARNACPFGAEYRYSTDQQHFHLAAFKRNQG